MNTKTTRKPSTILALAAIFATALTLPAQTLNYGQALFRWAGPASGGEWSDFANWTVQANSGSAPTAATTYPGGPGWSGPIGVFLNDATTDRVVILRAADTVNATFRYLWFDETATALNQFTIYRNNIGISNNVTLATNSGGTNKLFVSNYEIGGSGTTTANTLSLGNASEKRYIYVNTGGVLQLGGKVEDNNNYAATIRYADIVLNGGTLNLENALKTGTNNSVLYNLANGAGLTINSGTLMFTNASSHADTGNDFISDVRFMIDGNLTMTGGRIGRTGDPGRQIWLYGAENVISGGTLDTRIDFYLLRSGTTSLISSAQLNGVGLRVNGDTVATLGVTSAGNKYSGLTFQQSSTSGGNSITLKLGTNLTLNTNQALPSSTGSGPGVDTIYGIDTNALTLDLTGNTNVWTPNRAGTAGTATWALSDKSGNATGKIIANGFKFDNANVAVTVGEDLTLIAKGDGKANVLSSNSGGTIAASSTFIYDGGAGKSSTLASNLTLGKLRVQSGTLSAASALTTAGSLQVNAGGIFATNAHSITIGNGGVSLDIATLQSFGAITGASSIAGSTSLALNFTGQAELGDYQLFDASLAGKLSGISITGTYLKNLTNESGIWTANVNNLQFTFNETTGILNVATAIPEPSAIAFLFGTAALVWLVIRRSR